MPPITVTQTPTITDPELLALGRRITAEMLLGAQRAAAHTADPAAFPLPENATLEHLFLERFRRLPAERQQRAGDRARQLFRGPADARTALFGDLADVDVTAPRPLSDLLRNRPTPSLHLTADKLARAFARGAAPAKLPRKPLRPNDATEWLELRLHRAMCIDETDGFLGSEAGSDEINVGVVLLDPIQRTTKSPVFDLGEFESDGAARDFAPPLVLGGWDLRVGFFWPRSCTAVVYLSEIDNGGFPEWLQKVFEFAKSKAASAIASAIGAAIGGLIGAGIGAAVGALVGWAIGEIITGIKTWWEDDVFDPATFTIEVPSADATFGGQPQSPQFLIPYTGHGGQYALTADLRMTTRPVDQKIPGIITGVIDDVITDLAGVACALTSEPGTSQKMRDPVTGKVTVLPASAIPVERALVFALGRDNNNMMFRDASRADSPWTSIGGAFRSGPAVALTDPKRPVVFGRGTDDALWHAWRDSTSSPWSGWHSLGGALTSAPAAAMSGNRLVVAVRGTDMAIHHRFYDNGWSDWQSLGGVATSPPALVQAGNRLVLLCRGTDGAVWHKWYEGASWSDWHSLGGSITSAPAANMSPEGRLVVYARGTDGAIWHKWYENGWSDWHSLGGVSHSAPAAMVGVKKQGIVFCRGTDNSICERHYAGGWTPWASLGVP